MPSAFFLAQTAAEFRQDLPSNAKKAWMACHFSSYGTGLSNLPSQLPQSSMLIVNDRTPVAGHDPERIVQQLAQIVQDFSVSHVLLDFQRPAESETLAITEAITTALPCPVGVSTCYAQGLSCPVFLPLLPLHMSLAEYIAPWAGRPIWLEVAPACAIYQITEKGCESRISQASGQFPHFDPLLCCRYRILLEEKAICFTLCRGLEELAALRQCETVECFIGLYQEFVHPEAQATAFAQLAKRSARSGSGI